MKLKNKLLTFTLLLTFSTFSQYANASSRPEDVKKACDVLHHQLVKPTLPSKRIVLGSIINPFLPPEVKSQCTGTYDTGVPDLSHCHVEDGGFSRSCTQVPYCDISWNSQKCGTRESCVNIPNAPRTVCSNIIACNTYKTEKRFNVCEVAVTLKLPNFIAKPITDFIDSAYNVATKAQSDLQSALPLACASDNARSKSGENPTAAMAKAITNQIQTELVNRVKVEGEQWLIRTGIETVLASIPDGGIGGVAALATSAADLVETVSNIEEDYMEFQDIKSIAEDLNISVSCHPGEWSAL